MTKTMVVVIGASAGGVEALTTLVSLLDKDFPAPILVTVHIPVSSESMLPNILTRKGKIPASHPKDGESLKSGHIYIAPPNQHMILEDGMIRLSNGPRENGHRPAIDTMFRSAANVYGSGVIGIILSGTLDDGTTGLEVIKNAGGKAYVQDPDEAFFSGMPLSAIRQVRIDKILPLAGLAALMNHLVAEEIGLVEGVPPAMENSEEADNIRQDIKSFELGGEGESPTILTCPECGGAIWELKQGDLVRFQCHTGHAYSEESFFAEQTSEMEAALWTAVRSLEEKASFARRMASRTRLANLNFTADRYEERANEAENTADMIRKILSNGHLTDQYSPSET
jgi:two-component system chemotaxis response regulator CheB